MLSKILWKLSKDALQYIYPDNKNSYLPSDLLIFTTIFLSKIDNSFYNKKKPRLKRFYVNGLIHGITSSYTIFGHLYLQNSYKLGRKDGESIQLYKNGSVCRREVFKYDVLLSLTEYFISNTVKIHVTFGDKINEHTHWYKNGQMKKHFFSKKSIYPCLYYGKAHGKSEEWYPNGQIKERCFYINGKKHGKLEIWYQRNLKSTRKQDVKSCNDEQKNLMYRCDMVNGKNTGVCFSWYKNGKLRYISNCKNWVRNGWYKEWYSNGQLKYKRFYKNGVIQKQEAWWSFGTIMTYNKI